LSKGKELSIAYSVSLSKSSAPLELVFSDMWGAAPEFVGAKKYYVSFIDDFSKFTCIYLLKFMSEVFQKSHEFQNLVERLFHKKIITIQTDWGGEYEKFNSFQNVGITHHVSCPHAHQQNRSAEHKHRHIVEVGLSLLAQASMPLKFWDEAFTSVVYLINRTPSKVLNFTTPLERLFHIKPDYEALRAFVCACWPHLRPYNTQKLKFHSKQCIFLGYSLMHKVMKCLDISIGRVYIFRDVIFDENIFPFANPHPNAGARLQFEVSLLPPALLNPDQGGGITVDHVVNNSNHMTNSLGSDYVGNNAGTVHTIAGTREMAHALESRKIASLHQALRQHRLENRH
jgi:hypothetical protein